MSIHGDHQQEPLQSDYTPVPGGDHVNLNDMIKQCTSDSGRWFPGKAQTLPNLVLCMAGEVGEVANLVKKNVRGSVTHEKMMEELPEEVVDVLIYLCNLMGHEAFKDVDWKKIWNAKRAFNEARFGNFQDALDLENDYCE